MKRKWSSFIVFAIIMMLILSFAGCGILGGTPEDEKTPDNLNEDDGDREGENGQISEDAFTLTGDIPFSLESEFYFHLEVKSVAGALNPTFCTFTAIRKDETIYANYTYIKYKNATEYEANNHEEKYVEERILHDGVNFRKSFAQLTNTSDHLYTAYEEEWTTEVPQGTTITTTSQYIQNFLNGNHVADVPYWSGIWQTNISKIPSLMSSYYIHNISLNTASVDMYENGTENMNFGVFSNENSNYTPEQTFSAEVKKYKGTYYSDTTIMDVKTWGNIVVYAAQANGSPVLKRTLSCKYSPTVSQETFDAVLDYQGYTVDPVIPE